ncbi:MAG: S16 family serine protease [Verrucomicrobiota bacterium]
MMGTTWVLDGADKYWVRFESTSQMSWVSDSGLERGSSMWKPQRTGSGLDLADWQGSGGAVITDAALTTLRVVAGGRTWHGRLVRREGTGVLPELKPGGIPAAAPAVVAETKLPPGESGPGGEEKKTEGPPEPAPVAGGLGQPAGLLARTSRINGLLVMELPGGKMAGATSRMNAVAVPAPGRGEATLGFNQEIGPSMEKALQEVRKFHTVRHGIWPECYTIEVSFADKYSPKDGPSAAVACALLVEGLYTGMVWDESLAVTGDLNADGSVQPVGGVPAKIRGAVSRKCRIIGIPVGNERAVRDLLLAEGPEILLSINVFSLKEFDQARDLAMLGRPAGLATALLEFDKIIKAAPPKAQALAWIRQAAVATQLRKVIAAAPHHLSARLLLDFAEGRASAILSLTGSLEAIDREGQEVLQAIRVSLKQQNLSGIRKDGLGDALFRLRRLRGQMHPETRPLLDSMENYSRLVRAFLSNPPRTEAFISKAVSGIQSAGSLVDQQYRALKANPEVMAELMTE